jgi:hypothetical protein
VVGRASALLGQLRSLRALAFVALATVLGVYYAVADSLRNFSIWWEVAILTFLVIPAVFGLVYLALPLWRARWLLPAAVAIGVLAAGLHVAGLDIASDFAKLAAVTLLSWWFLGYFETAAWVVLVALIVPWVDAVSVWRGPTKEIVTHKREVFPVPGEPSAAHLGLPDILFFGLFLAATARFGLRTRLTWLAMALSFGGTMALSVAFDLAGMPALPLLALGFLLPNIDLVWKRLREEDAWARLRTENR